jgi:hypothetical protein
MSDLVSGRYPDTFEEWMLDGKPSQPYRTTISRRDILSTGVTPTVNAVCVYPVVVQQGDVIGAISIGVKTATAATASHGWAALYTGLTTSATLLFQSADDTSGFHGSGALQKFTLTSSYTVGTDPGTTGTNGPVVLGVALYNSSSGAGGALDGMTGSSVAGGILITGQVPMAFSAALAATATAPANLSGFTALTGGVPYIALSRS